MKFELSDDQFAEMHKFPADFYKMVSTATNLYDNVVMMKFLEAHSGRHERDVGEELVAGGGARDDRARLSARAHFQHRAASNLRRSASRRTV